MAAGDRGIVEADVRGQAAAHARPALLEGHDAHPLVVLEGDVVARRKGTGGPPRASPAPPRSRGRLGPRVPRRTATPARKGSPALGHSGTASRSWSAIRIRTIAAKRAGPGEGPGGECFHGPLSSEDWLRGCSGIRQGNKGCGGRIVRSEREDQVCARSRHPDAAPEHRRAEARGPPTAGAAGGLRCRASGCTSSTRAPAVRPLLRLAARGESPRRGEPEVGASERRLRTAPKAA